MVLETSHYKNKETSHNNFLEQEKANTIEETKHKTLELKSEIEQEKTQISGFMKIIYENNKPVYDIMAQKITSTPKQTINGQTEYYTVEEWSQTIEHIRWKITLGTLDPKLQEKIKWNPQLLHSIETGSSLYLTNWLNNLSSAELQQVWEIWWNIKWTISKATDLMNIFKNLTSFKNQMKSINTVFEGMDIYSKELLDNTTRDISQIPAFQTPEGFARLLTKHTPTSIWTLVSDNKSFDEYFDITETQLDITSIINNMKYGDKQHELMKKVITMWPQVLDKRSELQGTFSEVYSQISEVANLFTGGKPLSEALEWSFLGNVTNFVCAILGFGSLKQMERKWILKEFNKNCPELQRKGIEHSLAYISQLSNQPEYTNNNGFERYFSTMSWEEKNQILTILPNEQLLKDSFSDAVEKTWFFVHPTVLQQAGITNYLNYYNFNKETNTYTIKPETQSDYNQLLLIQKDKICESWRRSLLQPVVLQDMLESGRTQADLASYLMSGLSFPWYALEISRNNLVSASSIVIEKNLSQVNEQVELDRQKTLEEKKTELKTEEAKLQIIKDAKWDTKEVETKIKTLKKEIADLEWQNNQTDKKITTDDINFLNKWEKIDREEAKEKYGKTPAVRNFNPWNIMSDDFGWKRIKGERFTVFDNPQEWFQALIDYIKNIQEGKSKIYGNNPTLKSYMSHYAPETENNTNKYIESITKELDITEDTHINDIDPVALAIVHTKREDHKSHQMLKDLGIISDVA